MSIFMFTVGISGVGEERKFTEVWCVNSFFKLIWPTMQIIIQGLSRSHVLNFSEENADLLAIKNLIEQIEGIPVLEQRYTLNSKPLHDNFSVTSQTALELPPLRLSLRLLGNCY
jgi:hypothetical protein